MLLLTIISGFFLTNPLSAPKSALMGIILWVGLLGGIANPCIDIITGARLILLLLKTGTTFSLDLSLELSLSLDTDLLSPEMERAETEAVLDAGTVKEGAIICI